MRLLVGHDVHILTAHDMNVFAGRAFRGDDVHKSVFDHAREGRNAAFTRENQGPALPREQTHASTAGEVLASCAQIQVRLRGLDYADSTCLDLVVGTQSFYP